MFCSRPQGTSPRYLCSSTLSSTCSLGFVEEIRLLSSSGERRRGACLSPAFLDCLDSRLGEVWGFSWSTCQSATVLISKVGGGGGDCWWEILSNQLGNTDFHSWRQGVGSWWLWWCVFNVVCCFWNFKGLFFCVFWQQVSLVNGTAKAPFLGWVT